MNIAVFPRLEELQLSAYGGFITGRSADCYIHLAAPNLKILKLCCGRDDWVFLAELTHRLKFLYFLAIEMSSSLVEYIRHPSRPLTCAKFASPRLKEVYLEVGESLTSVTAWESKALPYLCESSTKVVRLWSTLPEVKVDPKYAYNATMSKILQLTKDVESLKNPCLHMRMRCTWSILCIS